MNDPEDLAGAQKKQDDEESLVLSPMLNSPMRTSSIGGGLSPERGSIGQE